MILFSLLVIAVIFIRRGILIARKRENEKSVLPEENDLDEKLAAQKISKSDKSRVVELCDKSDLNLRAGNEDEAIKFLVQALAIDELNVEAQNKLAMLYMQKQTYSAAAALFKRLGDITDDAVHFSHLGLAFFQQQNYEEAKQAYQKAIALDDSRPQRFASLGQVYRAAGELQNAIIAINRAVELDKQNMDYLFLLADLQTEAGNISEAMEILEKILTLDPANEEAKKYIKRIRKQQ